MSRALLPLLISLLCLPMILHGLSCAGGTISGGDTNDGGPVDADDGSDDCGLGGCPAGTECDHGICIPFDPCRDVHCENPGDVCSGGYCVAGVADGDDDGFPAREDCDDTDPLVFPGAQRACVNACGEGTAECLGDGSWGECLFETDPCRLDHAEAACVDGGCTIVRCEEGWSDCDGVSGNGCEGAIGSPEHCADCFDRCEDGHVCDGGTCRCVPNCAGAACGDDDGCGGRCDDGSCPGGHVCDSGRCRCVPSCDGAACGEGDGCGGTCDSGWCPAGQDCEGGRCRCNPDCRGAGCGDDDGCGGSCDGVCPTNERCRSSGCDCPGPNYRRYGGRCVPSCGYLLGDRGLYDDHGGCCEGGCRSGLVQAGGPGDTWDCTYCCEGNPSGPSCR